MVIHNRDVLTCLPLLASVLGRQYGVQVHIGGKKACTNGKVIMLPALPLDSGAELLATVRGYLDHEAAHVRYTDFACVNATSLDGVTFHLFNSIEDWRVEKRMAAIYPGCRQNLLWLIQKFFAEDAGAGSDDPALAVLNYVTLTVRAWDMSEVEPHRDAAARAIRQAFPGLLESLDGILSKVRQDCQDTAAAIVYARQIAACLNQWEPPEQDVPTPALSETSQEQNQRNEAENHTENEETEDKPENNNTKSSQDSDSASDASPEQEQDSTCTDSYCKEEQSDCTDSQAETVDKDHSLDGKEAGQKLTALFDLPADALPEYLGEALVRTLEASSTSNSEDNFCVAQCGQRHAHTLSPEEKQKALRSANALRHRLYGVLQAWAQNHCAIGRRGRLHTGSLYRISVGNPRVFQKVSPKTGINTAVHILLDASGSMDGPRIILARQACYAVTKALEGIKGVNPAVTAFPAMSLMDSVFPMVRHGERITDRFCIKGAGSTPLAPALWWTLQAMLPLRESRKIVLILTDGEPNDVAPCLAAIRQAERMGMEVLGIGIQHMAIRELLPNTSRIIYGLDELAPAMFDMLQSSLLKGGADDSC